MVGFISQLDSSSLPAYIFASSELLLYVDVFKYFRQGIKWFTGTCGKDAER